MQHYLQKFRSNHPRVIIASKDDHVVQELLKESAILIVDSSSVNFDFAYMYKPLIYFRFDKNSFNQSHLKPGYFVHETMGFGEVVEEQHHLVSLLEQYISSGCKLNKLYKQRIKDFYPLYDQRNCERIYQACLTKGNLNNE
jgi:CDP-glycerol glycerophosphotransferase (TagB/SpsB family)